MIPIRRTPQGFPMAPSQEEWDRLSETERAEVVAALPAEVTYEEMSPPEGDRHLGAKMRALDALRGFFFAGTAMLLESEELIARLEQMLETMEQRASEEARLRQEEARLREEEARLRQETERENARLRAEIERLTKK